MQTPAPILDLDIIENQVKFEDNAIEEDTWRTALVNILLCLLYSYLELRHYSCAMACANECIIYSDENFPDVYFRRAQIRTYNKFSNQEQLLSALDDILKARTKNSNKIYFEHYILLLNQIDSKKNEVKDRLSEFISMGKEFIINNNCSHREIDKTTFDLQYKILKEYKIIFLFYRMKLKYKVAIKYYTETKNEEQLNFAYNEIESFMENYQKFKWYYKFNFLKINSDELKLLQIDESQQVFIETYFKYKMSDYVFQQGCHNLDLIKYAITKVCKDEKSSNKLSNIQIDQNKLLNSKKNKICLFFNNENNQSNFSLIISFTMLIFSFILIFVHYYMYMRNPVKFFNNF